METAKDTSILYTILYYFMYVVSSSSYKHLRAPSDCAYKKDSYEHTVVLNTQWFSSKR